MPKRMSRGRGSQGGKTAARQNRNGRPPGRFRFNLDEMLPVALNSPPSRMPLLVPTVAWMDRAAAHKLHPAMCVDACLKLQLALQVYGIASYPAATRVGIAPVGQRPARMHGPEHAEVTPDGKFNGHMVLVVPHPGVFIDPTVQQFPEMRRTALAWMPVSVPLPTGARFEDQAFAARRDDCDIIYEPQAEPIEVAAIWRHPLVGGSNEASVRCEGEFLASMAFSVLRDPDLRARIREAPYPRLQRQLDVLGDAEDVIRIAEVQWNFRDRQTGAEIRLADIG
jgi:hypothetical protein